MSTGLKTALAVAAVGLAAQAAFLHLDRRAARPVLPWPPAERAAAEDAKDARARAGCEAVADLAVAYRAEAGHWPHLVGDLEERRPAGGPPLCRPEAIVNPWGKAYRLEADGNRLRVSTTTARGATVEARREVRP